jgi:hypothetical protein
MPASESATFTTNARARWERRALLLALLVALLVPAWRVFGPRGMPVQVQALPWQRDIEIERLALERGSAWCDELPAGAQDVSRRWLDDPEGRRGRAEHCRYQLPAWQARRSARAEGLLQAGGPAPHWPTEPALEAGSERLGKRHERYALLLRAGDGDGEGQVWRCELPQPRWQQFHAGQRLRLVVDKFGVADCSSLPG